MVDSKAVATGWDGIACGRPMTCSLDVASVLTVTEIEMVGVADYSIAWGKSISLREEPKANLVNTGAYVSLARI